MDLISFMSIALTITFFCSLLDALGARWRGAYFWLLGGTSMLFLFFLAVIFSTQGGSP